MWSKLASFLAKNNKGFGRQMLAGLGLGLASGALTLAVVNFYINKIVSSAGKLGDMAAILHLGGLDVAISIIIGAVIVRASISATKVSLTKAGK